MPSSHPTIGFRNLILIAVIGMVLLGAAIYLGVNVVVDRAVKDDAQKKAADWAAYLISNVPDIGTLMATGSLGPDQQAALATAEEVGDVFRFKLFDSAGGLVLVSDEIGTRDAAAEREHSERAAQVAATGRSSIELVDGAGRADRPPLYVEAYVPMRDAGGGTSGVVEIYLDQTQTAQLFRASFATLAVGLAIVAALGFGLPTLAFLLRSRQASEAREQAEFLAHHDQLTGTLNRQSFAAALEAGRAQRPGVPLAVVLFNVDDFKAVNDAHGQEVGDMVIRHMARAIAAYCGEGDGVPIARFGGDEFAVGLWGLAEAEVRRNVQQILRAIGAPLPAGDTTLAVRARAGIYFVEDEKATAADTISRTEVALYQARIDGGNTYRVFSAEMEAGLRARRELEQLIREALAEGLFEIHYQPLLSARNGRCVGFEALLRLPDRQGGLVPPGVFIPVAEAMGLIGEIGKWVIGRAARTATTWPQELFVSVNLSVKQFADGRLVEQVLEELRESGLEPRRLELEVTESVLMENTESVARQVRALREAGISIAMDDFGTGYSSLGYLWQFGFDKLKIDRSFVAALEVQDSQARDILATIIMLGHKLNMTVTAEGIETERQAEVLATLACDHFQGYLYGRPAPETEIPAFLAANRRVQAAWLSPQGVA